MKRLLSSAPNVHAPETYNQRAIVISAYVSTLDAQDKAKEAFCADLYNILT